MILLYVDGSGVPDLGDNEPLYVVVGMCVHEGGWFDLERRVNTLKQRFQLPGIPIELHAKDFCISFREQEKIVNFEALDWTARRRAVLQRRDEKLSAVTDSKKRRVLRQRFRATDPFVHLTRLERSRLYEEALDLVGSQEGVRLLGEIVDKRHLLKTKGVRSAVKHAFEQVVSRFDALLSRLNRDVGLAGDTGLLVVDQEPTSQRRIETLFAGYRQHGHPWGPMRHVIEAPFFVDSRKTSAVQAADLCAYAVRRYVGKGAAAGSFEEANFKRIFHKFDREGPRLHGLRHYCPRGTCGCLVCLERGHGDSQDD